MIGFLGSTSSPLFQRSRSSLLGSSRQRCIKVLVSTFCCLSLYTEYSLAINPTRGSKILLRIAMAGSMIKELFSSMVTAPATSAAGRLVDALPKLNPDGAAEELNVLTERTSVLSG